MVKKWQTLIEAHIDVKTTDGYLLRVFCIGFTQKQQHSTNKHCFAQSQQIRKNRKKMVACQEIYPLQDAHIFCDDLLYFQSRQLDANDEYA